MFKTQNRKKSKQPRRGPVSSTGSETERSLEDMISVTRLRIGDTDADADDAKRPTRKMKTTSKAPQKSLVARSVEAPDQPPFVALVGNLPMETSVRELLVLFVQHSIRSISLLRLGKGGGQQRKAHVELATRHDLMELLKKDQLLCRGRRLSISVCQDPGAAGDVRCNRQVVSGLDGTWSLHSGSDADESSSDYAVSVRSGQEREASSEASLPISRTPSSIEELERRMEVRLRKLSEFENAQTERAQSSQGDDEGGEVPRKISWPQFWSEVQKSEEL
ncbi:eukaryotic translation initiation factor 4H [Drosophila miranda]|uniref:eukaryotic translation initiation factor 4H n=1 Tax=Drosophila miranda TaxID=7229 RepID=UPI0007E6EEBC|nr:eukaryotic translation initiation factor 4H [Drosophila miranda]